MLLLVHPFSSSFFFLSNFQIFNIFVTLFPGTVRPTRLKLVTHMNNEWMSCVYQNQTAAAYLFLYFFIFLFLQFSNIKNFVTLLSGIVSPRKLKLGTHVKNGWLCRVYCNQAVLLLIHPFFLFFFPIFKDYNFHHTFLRNCVA